MPPDATTHHHGILAGVSAAAMAVIAAFGLLLLAWHRIAGAVGAAVTVIVWAVAAAVIGAVIAGAVLVFLHLRHRVQHPETLARQAVRAEVLDPLPQQIPAQPVAELPAGGSHTHYHFDSAEAVEAALQAMQERQITESNHDSA